MAVLLLISLLNLVQCQSEIDEFNLRGLPFEGYHVKLQIGTPPQEMEVIVDTGSSNLAVAGAAHELITKFFNPDLSTSYHDLNSSITMHYAVGTWSGYLARDYVTVASLGSIPNVAANFAIIEQANNFYRESKTWQGILGLGYKALARPDSNTTPWLDTVNRTTYITGFSLRLCGVLNNQAQHFGQFKLLNASEELSILGHLTSPIVREDYYGVDLLGITVGDLEVVDDFFNQHTIIDSGTTNLKIHHQSLLEIRKILKDESKLQGISLDDDFWKLYRPSCTDFDILAANKFPPITLKLRHNQESSIYLKIPAKSYIRRIWTNETLTKPMWCYQFSIEEGSYRNVLGEVVMEGYEITFSRSKQLISFKETPCGPNVIVTGPHSIQDGLITYYGILVFIAITFLGLSIGVNQCYSHDNDNDKT